MEENKQDSKNPNDSIDFSKATKGRRSEEHHYWQTGVK